MIKTKNYNCPHKDRPHHSFGLCTSCYNLVRYGFDEKFRKRRKEIQRKYYYTHREKKLAYNKEWIKKNPNLYRKIIILSIFKKLPVSMQNEIGLALCPNCRKKSLQS